MSYVQGDSTLMHAPEYKGYEFYITTSADSSATVPEKG
jgi:hypothetical protein